jgi:hypothetical protein
VRARLVIQVRAHEDTDRHLPHKVRVFALDRGERLESRDFEHANDSVNATRFVLAQSFGIYRMRMKDGINKKNLRKK